MNQRELLNKLKGQAIKLAGSGDDHDMREGFGMLRVIDAIENLPDHAAECPPDSGMAMEDMFMDDINSGIDVMPHSDPLDLKPHSDLFGF